MKKLIKKIIYRMELKRMDDIWHYMGGNCFGFFPPSFYYTHTNEEIDHIFNGEIKKLKELERQFETRFLDKVAR